MYYLDKKNIVHYSTKAIPILTNVVERKRRYQNQTVNDVFSFEEKKKPKQLKSEKGNIAREIEVSIDRKKCVSYTCGLRCDVLSIIDDVCIDFYFIT